MSYTIPALVTSPALVICLLDISESMQEELNGIPKIEYVNQAVKTILVSMVRRSVKGEYIQPRYRLAMAAYNDAPEDIVGGIQPIDKIAQKGTPTFTKTEGTSNTAAAFMAVRDLLREELPNLQGCPAPMVCHMTDGEYHYSDPEPIAQEIMQMANDDGNVLVENIYIGSDFNLQPITDLSTWPGVQGKSELESEYAKKLFDMSSPLPESYASVFNEEGYELRPNSRMLFPGTNHDLIELAFAMAGYS